MKPTFVVLVVVLMIPTVAGGEGDILQEKVYQTDTEAVWAMRWSYGNMWAGPLAMASRSEEGAKAHLTGEVKQLCRAEGWESFSYLEFAEIYAEDADPRLKLAWDHFGGSEQSTYGRKTSFQLVRFSDARIDPDRRPASETRETCWTKQQRKAAEKEAKEEAARKRRHEKLVEKERARQGGGP